MNCVDFRRIQLTEPDNADPDFLRHRRECRACAALANRSAQLEQQLRAALEVEVPEELSRRVLGESANQGRHPAVMPRYAWQALAAGVLLLVGFGTGLLFPRADSSLEDEVIRYVSSAPRHMAAPYPVSQEKLASLLEPVGAELMGSLGPVTSAHLCAIRERVAAHIELPGEHAPIVVLLIPGEQVAARTELAAGEWRGVLVPVHNGSLAIVGAHGELFTQIENRVRSAVTWRL